ncbi:septum formation initiator family protein [Gryllotalpicola reticulitermitis]|uniref:Septum formation initiator family protein n=1 Tax=Gryllotalpicola reticulitermitis TaxID=1184153 RepID=A0ABV8Q3L0_9MICO
MSTTRLSTANARGWLRGIRFSWFAVVMFGLIVMAVLVLAPTVRLYSTQQQQVSDLAAQNHAQQTKVDQLNDQIQDWDDPAYVKAQARDRLLYVMPGETSYLIINDVPKTAATTPTKVSTNVQQQTGDWSSTLLRSILEQPKAPAAKH